ncbi:hypothetical protein ACHHYP_08701 [Achlya hypogyna]|uniref:Transmembrane protein n=1 Tax=Achlya hypogyna TaxID=1202772 RepID=A0A1V9YP62_ACHHY|nr:hypothetical protein ACHHYP_08701 [Achlya hypogyna]
MADDAHSELQTPKATRYQPPLSKREVRSSFINLTRQDSTTDWYADDHIPMGRSADGNDAFVSVGRRALRNAYIGSLDMYSAFAVFWYHLITFETVVVFFNTVVATTAYYYVDQWGDPPFLFNYNLSWTLVTFAIISPIIMQTQQAYNRRESALLLIAETKALMLNYYMAHLQWIKPEKQAAVPLALVDRSRLLVRGIMYELCELLSLPTVTRGRHRFTRHGQRECDDQQDRQHLLRSRIAVGLRHLHAQVRDLKTQGLTEGEASRLYQYLWMIHSRVLSLINIKNYRTPQATRSFTKVFVHILAFFYGPYYVNVAKGDGKTQHTNFGFALCFAVLTNLMIIGVLNAEEALEDPFSGDGLDVVHMESMFEGLQQEMNMIDGRTS